MRYAERCRARQVPGVQGSRAVCVCHVCMAICAMGRMTTAHEKLKRTSLQVGRGRRAGKVAVDSQHWQSTWRTAADFNLSMAVSYSVPCIQPVVVVRVGIQVEASQPGAE